MPLKIFQDPDQTLMLMQKQWASQINPVLGNYLNKDNVINVTLVANTPLTFNHYLGTQMVGWTIVDNTAFCEVKRTQPLNSQTLTLEANANTTLALLVF